MPGNSSIVSNLRFPALLALCGFAQIALAHHGWSWYGNEPFTLTGTVIAIHLGSPHDRLTVDADGQRWNVVLSPPQRSRRAGFDENAIKVGETVTAYGHRRKEGDLFEMKTERLEVGDRTYDLYPERLR